MNQYIRDPTGLELILTDQCWALHITAHHPEMGPFRNWVVETVQTPDTIYAGKRDPSRRVYAKRHAHVPGLGNELTLLVFAGSEDRYVATAYFAAHALRQVGQPIWPST